MNKCKNILSTIVFSIHFFPLYFSVQLIHKAFQRREKIISLSSHFLNIIIKCLNLGSKSESENNFKHRLSMYNNNNNACLNQFKTFIAFLSQSGQWVRFGQGEPLPVCLLFFFFSLIKYKNTSSLFFFFPPNKKFVLSRYIFHSAVNGRSNCFSCKLRMCTFV